jgi:uncharacterized membrane protein
MKNQNQNKQVKITHRRKRVIRKFSFIVSISVILTIALLVVSCLLAIALWQTERDSSIYTLLITFCIFNVGETALTIYLTVLSVTSEYENRFDIARLINELKKRGIIEQSFNLPSPYEEKK